jgi:hypothetical protein
MFELKKCSICGKEFLQEPLYIYFVSEGQEKIGLSESITKELKKLETYVAKTYIDPGK